MTDNPRLRQLLDELHDSHATPEEVCRSCPELLPEVRARWQAVCRVRAELDALFPEPTVRGVDAPGLLPASASLPQVPGYNVEAELGHGGMGVVYRAWHLRLQRRVALKMLLAGRHAQPAERERFLREAEAVAGLRHPNIVQVYEAGDVDGQSYFTMELVEGGSLAEQIQGVPQPVRKAAALVATLADAVHAAHQSGIVHRDLKPANILLSADGTPKVTDFGLARRLQGGGALSLSGIPMGTPSYMAPEQARGQKDAAGPAADVYALGAILYELLSGRPPFRAATAAETLQQVISQEPAPPSRLNDKVPRDLETIWLKCLHKEPAKRYAGAVALADDLRRFLDGKPVLARPIGTLERAGRWTKRHPRETALAALGLLLILTAGAGAWWTDRQWVARRTEREQQEERTRHGVVGALEQARSVCDLARWPQAREALEQAALLVGNDGPEDLRQRVAVARRDLRMAEELDRIRQLQETVVQKVLYEAPIAPAYGKAFRDYGIAVQDGAVEDRAQRVRHSKIRPQLLLALDCWAFVEPNKALEGRLTAIARAADPDPWRDRVRNPALWQDPAALAELAATAPLTEQPVQLLVALGRRLPVHGVNTTDGVEFLRRVQQEHPADFLANMTLGNALIRHRPGEAIAYYQAALAIRPQTVSVHSNLGLALHYVGRPLQAIDLLARGLRIAPRDPLLHNNMGMALLDVARPVEATKSFRQALVELPNSAEIHNNLGNALLVRGQIDDAIEQCQEAIRIASNDPRFHNNLGITLQRKGRLNEAIVQYRSALRLAPGFAKAHYHLGDALLDQGRTKEGLVCLRRAIQLDPGFAPPHYRLGNFLKANGRLNEAIDAFKQAVRIEPNLASAHYHLGNTLKVLGRLDEAVDHYQQTFRIDPTHARSQGALGDALGSLGRFREARAAALRCLELLPKGDPQRPKAQGLLRQCDELLALEPRLPAILQGKDKPATAAEGFQFAEICNLKKKHVAAAGLYAAAVKGSPALVKDPRTGHRYNAACAATLAGSGADEEGGKLSEDERARWRKEARAWLRADLAAWKRMIDRDPSAIRTLAQQTLQMWQADPDLAGLRDPHALDKLPPSEREECRALWKEVRVLWDRVQSADPE